MGSQNQPCNEIEQFHQNDWVEVTPNMRNHDEEYGEFICYRHIITNQQIDKYQLYFGSQQEERIYYDCFLQRMREDYIVNSVYYSNNSIRQFCATVHQAEVHIQHIPLRLSDITDIPYPENIYILRNCLLGFQQLYDFIGYFQPHEDLICIDNFGEVKVWMNSDLSKNTPEEQLNASQAQQASQFLMVNRILRLIEENTDLRSCPESFLDFFSQNNHLFPTFKEALTILSQYVFKFRTIVPQYCESVIEIFRDAETGDIADPPHASGGCEDVEWSKDGDEGDAELVIGDTVIPKLEIGKNSRRRSIENEKIRKEQLDTIKRQWSDHSHFPINSTDRTKYMRKEPTERQQANQFVDHSNYYYNNSNRIPTKQTPLYRIVSGNQPKTTRPQISFTYSSRPLTTDRPKMMEEGTNIHGSQQTVSKIFQYSTGRGQVWEDLDPEIAADLSQFLE